MDIRGMAASAKRYQAYADRVRHEYAEKAAREEAEKARQEKDGAEKPRDEDKPEA